MERRVIYISKDGSLAGEAGAALAPLGCRVVHRQGLASGIRSIVAEDLVFLDLPEPLAALKEIKSYHPEAAVVIASESGCPPGALELGALDCIDKPFGPARLALTVRNALRHMALQAELEELKGPGAHPLITPKSPKMEKAVRQINRVAPKNTPVLITGERGSGKKTLARLLHNIGPRRAGLFLCVSCTENLEERLSGHSAFSSAAFHAGGGTIYIDDIACLDRAYHKMLSDFINGRNEAADLAWLRTADIRVVCSANGISKEEPILKSFAVEVKVPPLRERKEDILPLAEHFLAESAEAFATGPREFSAETRKALVKHDWPGNVLELKHMITKACLIAKDREINSAHLGFTDRRSRGTVKDFLEAKLAGYIKGMARLGNAGLHEAVVTEVEKALLELVLRETGGNQLKAAATLGITRTTLRTKIKNYGIHLGRGPGKAGRP